MLPRLVCIAEQRREGVFDYAGRVSHITFSPKHIDKEKNLAAAWQFTVNDSVQFNQLKMDGVHTYVEEQVIGEKLICDISADEPIYLKVVGIEKKPGTKATEKIKNLLKQGFRNVSSTPSRAPL